jgi:hypothetical protein
MKKLRNSFLLLQFSTCLFSCAFVPVNNQYEKAGTLQKGNMELSGNFCGNSVTGGGNSEDINNNLGFRIGYGLSDKFDLKLRYERLMPTKASEEDFNGANYFSIVPKIALIPGSMSLLIPISRYSFKENFSDVESKETLNSIAPQLLYTITGTKKKTDFTFGFKADFLFGGGGDEDGGAALIPGITLGAGFSSDLTRWAIRPELGASFLGGGAFLNYGVGVQYIISRKKR